jgi:hypothetical protein
MLRSLCRGRGSPTIPSFIFTSVIAAPIQQIDSARTISTPDASIFRCFSIAVNEFLNFVISNDLTD